MWHLLRGRTAELTLKLTDRDDQHCTAVNLMLWDAEAAGVAPDIRVTVTQAAIPDKGRPDWDAPTAEVSFQLLQTDIRVLQRFLQAATELTQTPETGPGQEDLQPDFGPRVSGGAHKP